MGIIAWIVLGLIVGAIAKAIMPGRDGGGLILTMLLGIIGGFVGGIIGKYVFHTSLGGFFDLRTWLLAILGSVVVLGIFHLATGSRRSVNR
ncbi:MAG TPA: GlsB/YeaQ/YmgE family stress response membrane protein [Pseudonocardiaceae bacterium]|nr:GlsB/YeaQ/YmgE family stress response membrane protein [Pseudonocardiaceae bacterium]